MEEKREEEEVLGLLIKEGTVLLASRDLWITINLLWSMDKYGNQQS